MSRLDNFVDGFIWPFSKIRNFFGWIDRLGDRTAEWLVR